MTLKSLNQDAVFQCELSAANRRVSWFLNGKQVSIGKKIVFEDIENVYQLTVTNASRDDIGSIRMTCGTIDTKGQLKIESKLDENISRHSRYVSFLSKMYCIERIFETLSNGWGFSNYFIYVISLSVEPKLNLDTAVEDEKRVKKGESFKIEIPFEAFPRPDVKWTLDDKAVSGKRNFNVDVIDGMTSLTVAKTQTEDAGRLGIEIKNEHGKCSHTIKLIVIGKV